MAIAQPKPVADGTGPAVQNKRLYGEFDLFGNNNYQSTGDLYTASQFGMAGITMVNAVGRDNTNTYLVAPVFPAGQSNNESFAPAPANMNLHWYTANGTEVTNASNLATSTVRVQIWGL